MTWRASTAVLAQDWADQDGWQRVTELDNRRCLPRHLRCRQGRQP